MKTPGKLFGFLLLGLSATALAGSCDNPYFPAGPGSSKTFAFRSKADGSSKSYTISVVNPSAGGFTLRYDYTNPVRVLENQYTCSAEGLTTPSLGAGSGSGPSANVTTQVKASSGVVIPAPERWKVGGSWVYTNQGTMATKDQNYTFKNEFTFQVVAQEQVKVPAGTFQTFKVTLTQKGEFGAKGASQPINYTLTQWYAKGVGLVRQEDQAGIHELVSYKP